MEVPEIKTASSNSKMASLIRTGYANLTTINAPPHFVDVAYPSPNANPFFTAL